jgi:hypothetical protein
MATIWFNATAFRALFSAFSDSIAYPDLVLQLYWHTATAYVNNQYGGCYIGGFTLAQQTLALNQMTAHLAYLNSLIGAGETPGIVQSSTIDKISVQLTPPPVPNQWQWWLNQSPYGQQLLALLQTSSVGGFYYGGFPVAPSFRR